MSISSFWPLFIFGFTPAPLPPNWHFIHLVLDCFTPQSLPKIDYHFAPPPKKDYHFVCFAHVQFAVVCFNQPPPSGRPLTQKLPLCLFWSFPLHPYSLKAASFETKLIHKSATMLRITVSLFEKDNELITCTKLCLLSGLTAITWW